MMRIALRAFAALALIVSACGPSVNDDDGAPPEATLIIEPATSEHMIANGVLPSQAFTATLMNADGTTEDVTAETTFFVDAGIGAFAQNTLTMGAAGKGTVSAAFGEATGEAVVIVRVKSERVDPVLPAGTPDLFTGTEDASLAPGVLYPPEGAIMPRNVGDFEIHWNDAHGHDVFEVSLKTEYTDIRVYVPGGNGVGNGPVPSWTAFLASEWAAAVGNETAVVYQVRGASTASPGVIGAGPARMVTLTNEALEGGIYYWAAASATQPEGIYRHDMAKPGEPAEQFFTKAQTSDRCVACHVLSRDGTKMAITWEGGGKPSAMVDVATRTATSDMANWNFATFTPDSTKLLTVSDGQIAVRNAADGAVLSLMPSDGRVSMPDLSPDGTRLVYVKAGPVPEPRADWDLLGGTIFVRTYDPITNAFGAETPLVADGPNNFYPSWSPDGEWILFNRGDAGGDPAHPTTSYNNPSASLWVMRADGTGAPVPLTAANQLGSGLTNSWGRWAPFDQTVGIAGETIMWVTVSSKRDFGVRLVGAGQPQIWMTPFFPSRANLAQDPSAPAFRLPFQSIESSNHIAQWTERVVVLQ